MAAPRTIALPATGGTEAFIRHPVAGAALLIVAAAIALIWANSAWAGAYFAWLNAPVTIGAGAFALTKPAQLWINDGLMAVFFFLVGLEIKREILAGALGTLRQAAFPLVAAVGGMAMPALIYVLFNAGTDTVGAWGVPMATDIAFALGVLAILGSRVPVALKVFLTAVAIVDDIGAITVIALFYSDTIVVAALGAGFGMLAFGALANRAGVRSVAFYSLLGVGIWFAFLKSGVHATLAAVLLAMIIPARAAISRETVVEWIGRLNAGLRDAAEPEHRKLLNHREHELLTGAGIMAQRGTPLLQRMEHGLVPFVTVVVLPVFALANAGVAVNASAFSLDNVVVVGIAVGLVLGNPIGIAGFAWVAVRVGLTTLPAGLGWRHIVGAGALGGIGFTMSMFIAGLAFTPAQLELAKIGILSGSLVSAVVGSTLLLTTRHAPATDRAPSRPAVPAERNRTS